MNTTHEQRQALAFIVNELRPDWDRHEVARILTRANPDAGLGPLALAAITAAITRTDQRTPAIITMTGPHWSTTTDPSPAWKDPYADSDALRDVDKIRAITRPMRDQLRRLETAR